MCCCTFLFILYRSSQAGTKNIYVEVLHSVTYHTLEPKNKIQNKFYHPPLMEKNQKQNPEQMHYDTAFSCDLAWACLHYAWFSVAWCSWVIGTRFHIRRVTSWPPVVWLCIRISWDQQTILPLVLTSAMKLHSPRTSLCCKPLPLEAIEEMLYHVRHVEHLGTFLRYYGVRLCARELGSR